MCDNKEAAYVFFAADRALLESLIRVALTKADILREIDLGLIVNHLLNQFTVHFPALLDRLVHAEHVIIGNLLLGGARNGIVVQVRR